MKQNESPMCKDATLEAFRYFSEYLTLLGSPTRDELERLDETDETGRIFALASDEAKQRFAHSILVAVTRNSSLDIPEEIALEALRAVCSGHVLYSFADSLFSKEVPPELRKSVFDKMLALFTDVFPLRCENKRIQDVVNSEGLWNPLCYMWWDLLPRRGEPDDAHLRATDIQIVDLLGQVLKVDHIACKQSALLGLSNWSRFLPAETAATIDEQLSAIPELLRDSALKAKSGELW